VGKGKTWAKGRAPSKKEPCWLYAGCTSFTRKVVQAVRRLPTTLTILSRITHGRVESVCLRRHPKGPVGDCCKAVNGSCKAPFFTHMQS
jgi:hypothetical protein